MLLEFCLECFHEVCLNFLLSNNTIEGSLNLFLQFILLVRSPSWLKSKWSKEKLLGKTLELKVLPCGLKTNIIDAPGDPNHLKETARGIWMGNLFVMVCLHLTHFI